MASSAKIIIKGVNQLSSPLKGAQKDLEGFSQVANKVGNALKAAFTVTAIVASVKKLSDALGSAFKDFNEAERKYKQMLTAIGDTKGFDKVVSKIKEMSKITLTGKDGIESIASELAGLGKNADEISLITEACVHLSNVTGKDLNSSLTTLLGTYSGSSDRLAKLIPEVKTLTKEQLAQGGAIDLIISKYGELSKAMAEDDSSQHITNIKNNLGDIKQAIGGIVDFSIAPALAKLDTFTENALKKVEEIAERIKLGIANIGAIWEEFIKTLKSSLDHLFSIEGISSLVEGIYNIIMAKVKLVGTALSNLATLFYNVLEEALKGIGNYAMYWITHVTDELGINISEVVNSIGDWLTTSPIGKFVDNIITNAVNGVRLVIATLGTIPDLAKVIFQNIGDLTSAFFKGIPTALKEIGSMILNRSKYIILKIKNDFLDALENVINNFGNAIQNSWLGKALSALGLNLGDKLASVSLGVDRTGERNAYSSAEESLKKIGEAFSDFKDIGTDMGKQVAAAMTPAFEKYVSNSTSSIGNVLATWTAKSTDEYYSAAKKNFSNIGDFLENWGQTFLGDLSGDWADLKGALTDTFDKAFGGDWEKFMEYLKRVTTSVPSTSTGTTPPPPNTTNQGSGNFITDFTKNIGGKLEGLFGATEAQGLSAATSVVNGFISSLGEAGSVVSTLASNMASMGPELGALVTAAQYVVQGFGEALGETLNGITELILTPLMDIGRMLGNLIVPILETLTPLIKQVSQFVSGIVGMLGAVLKPVITIISSALTPVLEVLSGVLKALTPVFKIFAKVFVTVTGTIEYVIQTLLHWVSSFLNWMSGLNIFGWQPLSFLSVKQVESPGNYGEFINKKWGTIEDAFNASTSESATSTATAVTNASYSGSTTVHLNVYNYGNVVGEGGIGEFAIMIRDKLVEADYLGR